MNGTPLMMQARKYRFPSPNKHKVQLYGRQSLTQQRDWRFEPGATSLEAKSLEASACSRADLLACIRLNCTIRASSGGNRPSSCHGNNVPSVVAVDGVRQTLSRICAIGHSPFDGRGAAGVLESFSRGCRARWSHVAATNHITNSDLRPLRDSSQPGAP